MPGMPPLLKPTNVPENTIEPPFRRAIAGSWALAAKNALVRLVSSVDRQLSVSVLDTQFACPAGRRSVGWWP